MRHALFAGTFDPPTLGHLNIIQRAAELFDKLTIAVAKDTRKEEPLLSVDVRLGLLKAITGLEAVAVEGLLADYVRSHKISALIRSLRSAEDFHREMTMAEANRRLCGVETVLLMPAPQYAAISSSLVREIARLGGDVSAFVPEEVVKALENM